MMEHDTALAQSGILWLLPDGRIIDESGFTVHDAKGAEPDASVDDDYLDDIDTLRAMWSHYTVHGCIGDGVTKHTVTIEISHELCCELCEDMNEGETIQDVIIRKLIALGTPL